MASMLSLIRRLISRPPVAAPLPPAPPPVALVQSPSTAPLFDGEPVPVYPEEAPAIPAAPPEVLIASQHEIVERLRRTLGYNAEDYEHRLRPVLERFAAYVHLLPASESHHHVGRGGLLRHSLEVATFAAIQTNGYRFTHIEVDVESTRQQKPRYILATVLAALLHDIAKPIVDLLATDRTGRHEWNPLAGSLLSWARRHELDAYRLQWRPGQRHRRHDNSPLGLAIAKEVIGSEIIAWIGMGEGEHILHQMFDAIYTPTPLPKGRNRINDIVRFADAESVRLDLLETSRFIVTSAQSMAERVASRLLRIVQEVVNDGAEVNRPNARALNTTLGAFGAMPTLIDAVSNKILTSNVGGLPQQPNRILDYLIEAGIVERFEGSAETYRTWKVAVTFEQQGQPVEATLNLLRFSQPHHLFGSFSPPPPLSARLLVAEDDEAAQGPEGGESSTSAPESEAAPVPSQKRHVEAQSDAIEIRDRRQTMAALDQGGVAAVLVPRPRTLEEARAWFARGGVASQFLITTANLINERILMLGKDICLEGGHAYIAETVAVNLGMDLEALAAALAVPAWLDPPEPVAPPPKIQQATGAARIMRLSADASHALVLLLTPFDPRQRAPAPSSRSTLPAPAPPPEATRDTRPAAPVASSQAPPATPPPPAPSAPAPATHAPAAAPANPEIGDVARDSSELGPPPPLGQGDVITPAFQRWAKAAFYQHLQGAGLGALEGYNKEMLIAQGRAFSNVYDLPPHVVSQALTSKGPDRVPALILREGGEGRALRDAKRASINPKYRPTPDA